MGRADLESSSHPPRRIDSHRAQRCDRQLSAQDANCAQAVCAVTSGDASHWDQTGRQGNRQTRCTNHESRRTSWGTTCGRARRRSCLRYTQANPQHLRGRLVSLRVGNRADPRKKILDAFIGIDEGVALEPPIAVVLAQFVIVAEAGVAARHGECNREQESQSSHSSRLTLPRFYHTNSKSEQAR